MARESAGAPALDLENYKKFYGFGIPKWSPYYYVTEGDDVKNAETIRRYKEEGGGALPRFQTHDDLRSHLLTMSDTELNRMRDFGCGKPHWSPYYVDPAYTHESRAIPGDKVSMKMTRPIRGEEGYVSPRASKTPTPRSARSEVPALNMAAPDPASNTQFVPSSSRRSSKPPTARSVPRSARSTDSTREARRIEELLAAKEKEVEELRQQLMKTRGPGFAK
ncbi:hypothetical protein TrST_g12915 [Triparma strigata]|uniref:Uncharacterized protein n=1 Tax=Triparma strigata TaxID=1606541 RepID=A0A9W7EGM5_9STRA|nr:hypothetical protein TrST_g12915 [Triparma strigata]